MKDQVMVWLAAFSLHHQDRVPFRSHELMDEIKMAVYVKAPVSREL